MKFVLDASVAAKWYFHDADYLKAFDLRWNFFQQVHELLASDTFPAHCGDVLTHAEKKKIISNSHSYCPWSVSSSKVGRIFVQLWRLCQNWRILWRPPRPNRRLRDGSGAGGRLF
jgi:hypothetical protein